MTSREKEPEEAEPPRRGTLAYRRLLLTVIAADDLDEFGRRIGAARSWAGWRLSVDHMTELLWQTALTTLPGSKYRDAFGRLPLEGLLKLPDEEGRVAEATRLASQLTHLPFHEAFASMLEAQGKLWDQTADWWPVWQAALDAIEDAGGSQQAAWPVILKHLNTKKEGRDKAAHSASDLLQSQLRSQVLPWGDDWVQRRLQGNSALVESSQAFYGKREYLPDALRCGPVETVLEELIDSKGREDAPQTRAQRRRAARRSCTCGRH